MIPPGIPDFLDPRARSSPPGRARSRVARGRAGPDRARRGQLDGGGPGPTPSSDEPPGPARLARLAFDWDAPGEHVLSCRAHDTAGNTQPHDPPWNLGGYANNAVQRVPVTVRA